jgi:hypothetical protein
MTNTENVGRRKRGSKPERIPLGDGEEAWRNDIVASDFGESERTLNRMDKDGAPYLYCGGCKYRPINAFRAYRASLIKRQGQPPRRRHRVGT